MQIDTGGINQCNQAIQDASRDLQRALVSEWDDDVKSSFAGFAHQFETRAKSMSDTMKAAASTCAGLSDIDSQALASRASALLQRAKKI